jgi:hypothetical protein
MRSTVILCLALLLASPALARSEIKPAEDREVPYSGTIPPCDYEYALAKVSQHFAEKEDRFWNSQITIEKIEKIRHVAYRPWGLDYIPRRYCTGTAHLSNGKKTRVDYSIREDLGIIGIGFGVEFCVVGYDRNRAYAPNCRMAQP